MNLLQYYIGTADQWKERTDESIMKQVRSILNQALKERHFGHANIARGCYEGLCKAGLEDRILIIFTREGAKLRLITDHQPNTITGVINEIHLKDGATLPKWARVGGKQVKWDEPDEIWLDNRLF